MPPNKTTNTTSGWAINIIFAIVCLVCLLLAIVAGMEGYTNLRQERMVQQALSKSQTCKADDAPCAATQLKNDLDNLKDLTDYLRDRTDDLQKLITTLIALSSLYAIVLAVTGYLNVQKVTQDASVLLQDATDIKRLLGEEYGSLTQISKNLAKMTHELSSVLPDVQELSISIRELPPETHERVYFQEKGVAFAQLVAPENDPKIARSLSGAFAALSRFHRGLYLLKEDKKRQLEEDKKRQLEEDKKRQPEEDNKQNAENARSQADSQTEVGGKAPVSGDINELRQETIDELKQRALFYATQAVLHSPDSFAAHNELGCCLLDARDHNKALEHFEKSRKLNMEQQKALYFIAVSAHRNKGYRKAENLLTEALALQHWETTAIYARRCDLHYNRACAYGQLAKAALDEAARVEWLTKALEDLKRADVHRSKVGLKDFRERYRNRGRSGALGEPRAI